MGELARPVVSVGAGASGGDTNEGEKNGALGKRP